MANPKMLAFVFSSKRISHSNTFSLYTENRNEKIYGSKNKEKKRFFFLYFKQYQYCLKSIIFFNAFRHQHNVMDDGAGILIVQNRKFAFTIYKNKIKSNEKANVLPLFNIAENLAPFKMYI